MRILFVENNRTFAETVSAVFLSEHAVTIVPTVGGALEHASTAAFDAVLVDYELDDGKGDDVIRGLRAQAFSGIIVAMSSDQDGNASLLAAGATAACLKEHVRELPRILERLASNPS